MSNEQRGCTLQQHLWEEATLHLPFSFSASPLPAPHPPPWLCWPVCKRWDNTPNLQNSLSTENHELNASCPSTAVGFPAGEHAVLFCLPDLCFIQMWLKAEASCNMNDCHPRGLKSGCTCAASMCGWRAMLPTGFTAFPSPAGSNPMKAWAGLGELHSNSISQKDPRTILCKASWEGLNKFSKASSMQIHAWKT